MMEIVIKIPEEIMEYIKNNGCLSVFYIDEVAKAIRNGTPLPKGHGRLIDTDALEYEIASVEGYSELDYECVAREDIDQAPTIIEADKESEVDE